MSEPTPSPTLNPEPLNPSILDEADSTVEVRLRLSRTPLGREAARMLQANATLRHQKPNARLAQVLSEKLGRSFEVIPA